MSGITFEPAVRDKVLLRAALIAATGGGKTHGALKVATAIAPVEEVAVIDAENGRALLEVPEFGAFRHGLLPATMQNPPGYTEAMNKAFAEGAKVVIIDSVSPEWKDCLSKADRFGDWKQVRPPHEAWIESMKYAPGHLIVTMRAKMKYSVSEEEVPGRTKPRQVIDPIGMGPIQDDNLPYEFDVVAYLDRTHLATFSNRCKPLEGKTMTLDEAAPVIVDWLGEGEEIPSAEPELIENLRGLLREEGFADDLIEGKFTKAREGNHGRLHPDYVAEQTTASEARLDAKKKGAGAEQPELAATT